MRINAGSDISQDTFARYWVSVLQPLGVLHAGSAFEDGAASAWCCPSLLQVFLLNAKETTYRQPTVGLTEGERRGGRSERTEARGLCAHHMQAIRRHLFCLHTMCTSDAVMFVHMSVCALLAAVLTLSRLRLDLRSLAVKAIFRKSGLAPLVALDSRAMKATDIELAFKESIYRARKPHPNPLIRETK